MFSEFISLFFGDKIRMSEIVADTDFGERGQMKMNGFRKVASRSKVD